MGLADLLRGLRLAVLETVATHYPSYRQPRGVIGGADTVLTPETLRLFMTAHTIKPEKVDAIKNALNPYYGFLWGLGFRPSRNGRVHVNIVDDIKEELAKMLKIPNNRVVEVLQTIFDYIFELFHEGSYGMKSDTILTLLYYIGDESVFFLLENFQITEAARRARMEAKAIEQDEARRKRADETQRADLEYSNKLSAAKKAAEEARVEASRRQAAEIQKRRDATDIANEEAKNAMELNRNHDDALNAMVQLLEQHPEMFEIRAPKPVDPRARRPSTTASPPPPSAESSTWTLGNRDRNRIPLDMARNEAAKALADQVRGDPSFMESVFGEPSGIIGAEANPDLNEELRRQASSWIGGSLQTDGTILLPDGTSIRPPDGTTFTTNVAGRIIAFRLPENREALNRLADDVIRPSSVVEEEDGMSGDGSDGSSDGSEFREHIPLLPVDTRSWDDDDDDDDDAEVSAEPSAEVSRDELPPRPPQAIAATSASGEPRHERPYTGNQGLTAIEGIVLNANRRGPRGMSSADNTIANDHSNADFRAFGNAMRNWNFYIESHENAYEFLTSTFERAEACIKAGTEFIEKYNALERDQRQNAVTKTFADTMKNQIVAGLKGVLVLLKLRIEEFTALIKLKELQNLEIPSNNIKWEILFADLRVLSNTLYPPNALALFIQRNPGILTNLTRVVSGQNGIREMMSKYAVDPTTSQSLWDSFEYAYTNIKAVLKRIHPHISDEYQLQQINQALLVFKRPILSRNVYASLMDRIDETKLAYTTTFPASDVSYSETLTINVLPFTSNLNIIQEPTVTFANLPAIGTPVIVHIRNDPDGKDGSDAEINHIVDVSKKYPELFPLVYGRTIINGRFGNILEACGPTLFDLFSANRANLTIWSQIYINTNLNKLLLVRRDPNTFLLSFMQYASRVCSKLQELVADGRAPLLLRDKDVRVDIKNGSDVRFSNGRFCVDLKTSHMNDVEYIEFFQKLAELHIHRHQRQAPINYAIAPEIVAVGLIKKLIRAASVKVRGADYSTYINRFKTMLISINPTEETIDLASLIIYAVSGVHVRNVNADEMAKYLILIFPDQGLQGRNLDEIKQILTSKAIEPFEAILPNLLETLRNDPSNSSELVNKAVNIEKVAVYSFGLFLTSFMYADDTKDTIGITNDRPSDQIKKFYYQVLEIAHKCLRPNANDRPLLSSLPKMIRDAYNASIRRHDTRINYMQAGQTRDATAIRQLIHFLKAPKAFIE